MKKRLLAMLLASSMLLSLAACGGDPAANGGDKPADNGGDAAKEPSGEAFVLKMNSIKTTSDPMYEAWSGFCDRITEASNGTLDVQIYPSESLGATTDMIESISKGTAAIQDCDFSHLADYVPDYSAFMMPYLLKKPEDVGNLWLSDLGQELEEQLHAKGLRIITAVYFGERNWLVKKPFTNRAEASGMKLRCAPTKMWTNMVDVIGGNATTCTWSETYQAISQGVADGCESPVHILYSAKIHEVAKYLVYTKHLYAPTIMVMSEEVFQSLPKEAQDAITSVGEAYPAQAIEEVNAVVGPMLEEMKKSGVEEVYPDEAAIDEWRNYSMENVPKNFPEWSDNLVERIQEAIA
ncbi:TRAP transporter substrate-binding protein DctP [Agathobaculum sp.]|uniref:TRAP transporter substrate-binding protein DctP n=1 Tax=Agathobaculum sp. TaxID=2048138 RepID=UPI002A805BF5|nr:TRAP transporter substrate-binding protein DctP [Agathobaculum sp.]MDY3618484.1 TRAP transporter substrate-binding protein DctP [Agathobaculum sp.]